jgi:mRNA-degrading endonuclease toxin of MazEF toxin-antitoxin module
VSEEDRGTAMAASLARAARSFGVPPPGIALLAEAHALAMGPRAHALGHDDHHPLYLHPGRTVLILLRDAGVTDPVVLAGAALTESEDPAFRIPLDRVRGTAGPGVADLVGGVPMPGTETLAEVLVTADEPVRLVALAERLDHARHAHLRETDEAWRRALHEEVGAVYLPIAERTHPRLAQRYRHWWRVFGRRLGEGAP